jgi:hypothetical protein
MRFRNGALATGAVATLAALGLVVSVAGAQGMPGRLLTADDSPHPIQVGGRVDKVDAATNSLTLAAPKGSFTVSITDKTWVLAEKNGKCGEATLADIKANQNVMVAGMTTTTANQINARAIVQGGCFAGKAGIGPGGPGGKLGGPGGRGPGKHGGPKGDMLDVLGKHMAMGTIKSVSGNTIILSSERGDEVTVTTTANTVVLSGGFKATSTLKAGDKVQVLGSPAGMPMPKKPAPGEAPADKPKPARNIEAWGIRIVTDASKLVVGRVEKVDGNTITLRTRQDGKNAAPHTITLDGSTAYKSATLADRKVGLSNAAQADVKVGSIIMVEGVTSANANTLAAKAVILMPVPNGKMTKP